MGSDVVLEHADGIVQPVTASTQRLLADWKPDVVALRSPLAVVFETYNRRSDGIRLSPKLARVRCAQPREQPPSIALAVGEAPPPGAE